MSIVGWLYMWIFLFYVQISSVLEERVKRDVWVRAYLPLVA